MLLSAFARVDPHLKGILAGLRKRLVKGGVPAFFDEAVRLVVTPQFLVANSAAIMDSKEYAEKINSTKALINAVDACLAIDLQGGISRINRTTLIISGREDIFTRPILAEEVHNSIRDSIWTLMDGVGHNLIIPQNIAGLILRIQEFLAAQPES